MISGPDKITGAINLGQMFNMAGYTTFWAGKHHGIQSPLDLGFDRYYGLRDGCCNYFNPGDQRPGVGKPARKALAYPRKWIKDGKLSLPYAPEAQDFYSCQSAIINKKPLIIWGDLIKDDLDYKSDKLPVKGLLVIPVVKDRHQAREIWRRFNK
jgi:arylsulfatase A-like enzyme